VFPHFDESVKSLLKRLVERKVPIIVGGCTLDDIEVDEIITNNISGITKAVEYLLRTGRKKIGFVSGSMEEMGNKERYQGYVETLKKESIEVNRAWLAHGEGDFEDGLKLGLELLGQKERPEAVVCTGDVLALGVMRAAAKLGLKIPAEVAVIGFDDTPWTRLTTPSLTTLYMPLNRIARDTINLLISRIQAEGARGPSKKLVYEPELIIRESA
jgi:LacI family transcriptional regulator